MTNFATLSWITIDCAAPIELAAFYTALTGWEPIGSSEETVYLGLDGQTKLVFQRVEGHRVPAWSSNAKQFHLDFKVVDLVEGEARAVELGATRPQSQPGKGRWVVLADPEGRQFCLSQWS